MSYELLYMKGVVYVTDIYDCLWFLEKKKYIDPNTLIYKLND